LEIAAAASLRSRDIGKHIQKFRREQRVAIMDQVELAMKDSVNRIRSIPANLIHP